MGMASAVQHDLWAAVERGDGARYAEISDELELQPAPRTGRGPSVPLRLGLLPTRGVSRSAKLSSRSNEQADTGLLVVDGS